MSQELAGVAAAVITVSDRRSLGTARDTAGPVIADALAGLGAAVTTAVVPDGTGSVAAAISGAIGDGAVVVITTGGTGVAPRDLTPEATATVIERDLPGIPELLRREGARTAPHAALSRGIAGTTTQPHPAVVINLPGSESAARDGIAVLAPLLPHLVAQLGGVDH